MAILCASVCPSALQQVSLHISNLTLNGIVNTGGLIASAAYGIGVKLDSFVILPGYALSDAVAAITSQNLGVDQKERAIQSVKAARKLALVYHGTMTIVILLFAPFLASIFNPDAQVMQTTAAYLRISCLMYPIYVLVYPTMGFVKGSGNAMFTFTNSIITQYVVRIPIAFFLANVLGFGIYGVAMAWVCAPIYSACAYLHYYHSGKWEQHLELERSHGHTL